MRSRVVNWINDLVEKAQVASSCGRFSAVKTKGKEGYFTVSVCVTAIVQVAAITQGQQVGATDNSGCQKAPTFIWRAKIRTTS